MTVEQKDLQSFFYDDYQIILIPASGFEGSMYLLREEACGPSEVRHVTVEEVEDIIGYESDVPVAERLDVRFFTAPKAKVLYFAEYGEAPFNEQVNDILLDCDDMEVEPPYRKILSWIRRTGEEDVPAPELVIPENWDEYKSIMSLQ